MPPPKWLKLSLSFQLPCPSCCATALLDTGPLAPASHHPTQHGALPSWSPLWKPPSHFPFRPSRILGCFCLSLTLPSLPCSWPPVPGWRRGLSCLGSSPPSSPYAPGLTPEAPFTVAHPPTCLYDVTNFITPYTLTHLCPTFVSSLDTWFCLPLATEWGPRLFVPSA